MAYAVGVGRLERQVLAEMQAGAAEKSLDERLAEYDAALAEPPELSTSGSRHLRLLREIGVA